MAGDDRERAREAFLRSTDWRDAAVEALPGDASFRRYFRLDDGPRAALLMDSPPATMANPLPGFGDVRPFVEIARHLVGLGLSAPEVYAVDEDRGFAVIEDFGDATYTRMIASGTDPLPLYELAIDVLTHLHGQPAAAEIATPPYDEARLLDEVVRLVDWYRPALTGEPTPDGLRESFLGAWRGVLRALPEAPATLVLLDYHVDNLMLLAGREGVRRCGLLDFQDALTGHPAYDLMSLLEDARRDIPAEHFRHLMARYAVARPEAENEAFKAWYAVLAAQRHARIAGQFVRLNVRDGKPGYLAHLPRVVRLLERALAAPALEPVKAWLDGHMPALGGPLRD